MHLVDGCTAGIESAGCMFERSAATTAALPEAARPVQAIALKEVKVQEQMKSEPFSINCSFKIFQGVQLQLHEICYLAELHERQCGWL